MRNLTQEIVERVLNSDPELSAGLDAVYEQLEGVPAVEGYHERHMTQSLGILTVCSAFDARRLIKPLRGKLLNKSVVEIGAGVGFLALELARYAHTVFAIESDPGWSWFFTHHLYQHKPPHLTWIFGRAESIASVLRADIAVIATHSGHKAMEAVARRMATEVIWIHGEREI